MKSDTQIDLNNYYIEAKYLMYIPSYELKSNKFSSYSAGLDPVIKNSTVFKIPPGIKTVESQTFWDWENLTEIFIPNTVTEIEAAAFDYCMKLKDIYVPKGALSKFLNCEALTESIMNYNFIEE